MQRVDPKQFFSKISPQAVKMVALFSIVLIIVIAASWSLSFITIIKGLGFGILFVVVIAQPIAFYWARRDQTETCNQRIGLFILIGGLIMSGLIYAMNRNLTESVSALIIPLALCVQGLLVKPEA